MPNWCENDLTVSGPKSDVVAFEAKAKGENGVLDANSFIPYPVRFKALNDQAREQDRLRGKLHDKLVASGVASMSANQQALEKYPWIKDGYNQGGYEWCIEHWGTKWNLSDVEETDRNEFKRESTVSWSFNTPWAPPIHVIRAMAKAFPTLTFELCYFECGEGFNGILRCVRGKVDVQKEGEYFGNRGG